MAYDSEELHGYWKKALPGIKNATIVSQSKNFIEEELEPTWVIQQQSRKAKLMRPLSSACSFHFFSNSDPPCSYPQKDSLGEHMEIIR